MNSDLSAVVVAAGKSRRFNQSLKSDKAVSKQLLEWEGAPLFIHSLRALSQLDIAEWALVISPDEEAQICAQLKKYVPDLKIKIAFGGERRQDSVRNGLSALSSNARVFVHDAARPFITLDILSRLNEASKNHAAVIPAMKVVETLKEVDASGRVIKTHDRNRFVRIQTPQFFAFDILKRAHLQFATSEVEFTDDAMMLESLGVEVLTVAGDPENIKVTTVEDLRMKGIHV